MNVTDRLMAEIEKGQLLAGHIVSGEALDRARRVLIGETSVEEARGEIHMQEKRDAL